MDTKTTTKALCFFAQEFVQKHNAFFSLKQNSGLATEQAIGQITEQCTVPQEFWAISTDLDFPMYVFDTITSTLDKAHELSKEKEMHAFTTLICQKQLAGRGQLRRKWESLENNLYTAVFLPNFYPFNTEAAAPAFGGMVAHALEKLGFSVELKWPNDIVQKTENGYEKVGGILLEERNHCLVAGMGINLFSSPQNELLRDNFFISAGKLQNFSAVTTQKKFLNYFNNSLLDWAQENAANKNQPIDNIEKIDKFFVNLGFCFALVKEINLWYKKDLLSYNKTTWNTLCKKYLAFLGDSVRVKEALVKDDLVKGTSYSGDIVGQIVGLGEEGELILSSENGLISIVGGSITK